MGNQLSVVSVYSYCTGVSHPQPENCRASKIKWRTPNRKLTISTVLGCIQPAFLLVIKKGDVIFDHPKKAILKIMRSACTKTVWNGGSVVWRGIRWDWVKKLVGSNPLEIPFSLFSFFTLLCGMNPDVVPVQLSFCYRVIPVHCGQNSWRVHGSESHAKQFFNLGRR